MRLGWTVVAATTAGLALSALTAVPAYAAPPPVPEIAAPDTTVPGHVTGTIISDEAPYLTLRLGTATSSSPAVEESIVLPGSVGSFDLLTWGFSGTTYLWARACRAVDSPATDCTGWVRMSPSFVPNDVAPVIGFSDDLTVGPADSLILTAEDSGGGALVAFWTRPGVTPVRTTLDQHGPTVVDTGPPGPGGTGTVEVRRCTPAGQVCSSFTPPITQEYTVRKQASLTAAPIAPIAVANAAGTSVTFTTDGRGTYQVDWTIKNGGIFGSPVRTGVATGTVNEDGTLAPIPIEGAGLNETNGSFYRFHAEITIQDPDFGTLEGTTGLTDPEFRVDRVAPDAETTTIAPKVIYPNVDLDPYPGATTIKSSANDMEFSSWAIRNTSGTLVRVLPRKAPWNGNSDAAVLVPAGTYRIYARDASGNEGVLAGTVIVSHRKLVTRTWRKKVTARGTVVDTYVGRCSALNSPATRGWRGSVGYYANVRCGNTGKNASSAATLHATKLINAPRYLSIRVLAYGGASRRAAGSTAFLRYVKVAGGTTHQVRMAARLRTQYGLVLGSPNTYIRAKDRQFRWNVYTRSFNRYDVRDFTIVVRYQTLG